MCTPVPSRLLTLAALAIGSGLGIHLGQSAIVEINPIYFSVADSTRFFADLAPQAYQVDDRSEFEPADFWARDLDPRAETGCRDCTIVPDLNVANPIVAPAPASSPDPAPRPDLLAPAADIDRYAYFPVTQEEARRPWPRWETGGATAAPDAEGPLPETVVPVGM